jgi:hypothetical protein
MRSIKATPIQKRAKRRAAPKAKPTVETRKTRKTRAGRKQKTS